MFEEDQQVLPVTSQVLDSFEDGETFVGRLHLEETIVDKLYDTEDYYRVVLTVLAVLRLAHTTVVGAPTVERLPFVVEHVEIHTQSYEAFDDSFVALLYVYFVVTVVG